MLSNITTKLLECDLLSRMGQQDDFDFEVKLVSEKEMLKGIKSTKWENTVLENRGDFTVYLHKNHNSEYQKWNEYTAEIKAVFLRDLSEKIKMVLGDKDQNNVIYNDVIFNILTLFMIDKYDSSFESDFFEKLCEIYLAGHLPCGFSDGKILVF